MLITQVGALPAECGIYLLQGLSIIAAFSFNNSQISKTHVFIRPVVGIKKKQKHRLVLVRRICSLHPHFPSVQIQLTPHAVCRVGICHDFPYGAVRLKGYCILRQTCKYCFVRKYDFFSCFVRLPASRCQDKYQAYSYYLVHSCQISCHVNFALP